MSAGTGAVSGSLTRNNVSSGPTLVTTPEDRDLPNPSGGRATYDLVVSGYGGSPTDPGSNVYRVSGTWYFFERDLVPSDRGAACEAPLAASNEPTDSAFYRVWSLTDLDVHLQRTSRSWTWGPQPYRTRREAYAQSPGGQRLVEYYDKSRMEINNPNGDRNNLFFVTNGLLPIELITGRMKTGDAPTQYQDRPKAEVAVAGDPASVNPVAPTYRSLYSVVTVEGTNRPAAPRAVNSTVMATLNRAGTVGQDSRLSSYNVRVASYQDQLGHNIADVFQRYMATLPIDSLFATGYAISEP